MLLKQAQRCR